MLPVLLQEHSRLPAHAAPKGVVTANGLNPAYFRDGPNRRASTRRHRAPIRARSPCHAMLVGAHLLACARLRARAFA